MMRSSSTQTMLSKDAQQHLVLLACSYEGQAPVNEIAFTQQLLLIRHFLVVHAHPPTLQTQQCFNR